MRKITTAGLVASEMRIFEETVGGLERPKELEVFGANYDMMKGRGEEADKVSG